jgi:protein-S-isoprenylcysteine O-methyltransferase Ste14
MAGQSRSSNTCRLIRLVVLRFVLAIVVLGLVFFLSAGTFKYWHAWVYCGILFIPMSFVLFYLLKNDPALLERRMRTKEEARPQKLVIKLATFVYAFAFLIPGFDYRFKWSSVPIALVITSDIVVFLGYLLFFLVLKENSYASRVVEVEKGQKVISSGPYAFIRHPLYLAVVIMFLFSPIALGSFWAMITVIPLPLLLAFRIKDEERLLIKELVGYQEYTQRVRYRLIPKIW